MPVFNNNVKNKLLEIARLFRESLNLYITKDIRITGSFANYNYSDERDDEGNYKSAGFVFLGAAFCLFVF